MENKWLWQRLACNQKAGFHLSQNMLPTTSTPDLTFKVESINQSASQISPISRLSLGGRKCLIKTIVWDCVCSNGLEFYKFRCQVMSYDVDKSRLKHCMKDKSRKKGVLMIPIKGWLPFLVPFEAHQGKKTGKNLLNSSEKQKEEKNKLQIAVTWNFFSLLEVQLGTKCSFYLLRKFFVKLFY